MSNPCFGPPIEDDPADASSSQNDEELALLARALAHPARIKILRLLASHSICTGADLFPEIDLAQSTVSEHLRILKEAGIVTATPSGACMCYRLVPAALVRMGLGVTGLVRNIPAHEAAAANAGNGPKR